MKFSTRNDREKSFVNPERAASKIWRRLACAMLCVVLLGSNLTVAFATEGTTLTENEPVVTEQTAEVPETTEPKVPETTEPKAPETSEPETPETTEPKAPETSEPETPETTEPKAPETSEPETPETTEPKVPETTVPETTVPETTVPETTVPETTVPEEEAVTYTLRLTHVFRFKVDGKSGSVQASEEITLTEADFVDGVCDISRFAQKAEQIQVTKANPVSIKEFDANHKGGTQILYAVKSGWKVVRKENATGEGSVLREVFSGKLSNYEFVPTDVIRIKVEYKYSNTGGLAGVDAASPAVMEAVPEKQSDDGTYKVTWDLPVVEGFRIVLNPGELNKYVVNPPDGTESAAELKKRLENGDFDVDIDKHEIYYYQESSSSDVTVTHPQYRNRYSTKYNEAWNAARTLTAANYTATAVGENTNPGASALTNPKLEVTLTEDQLNSVLENGTKLDITVYYRRNATWYTVNHWVPTALVGTLTGSEEKKNVDGTEYVRLDQETLQGRVGARTRAAAKTENVYEQLQPVGFSQKLIENTDTVVDIDYKAADSYRVIFDTDYTYIPRQQVALGSKVDFTNLTEPKRTGYTFDGWRYLNKNATPNPDGSYNDNQYTELDKNNPELTVDNALIGKAKLTESGGVLALHLYPKWTTATTNVRVILWTEDLTGTDDVQAFATDGNADYYNKKYANYGNAPKTHDPQPGTSNSNYSNAGSFTVDVDTDSSLVEVDNAKKLLEKIQTRVKDEFKVAMGQVSGIDVANFYTQAAFEIVHEEESGINYKATTASADGKTTIYVYFTRNVYELRFTYYGTADNSNYSVAKNTNGYSWGGINDAASVFPGGDLNFGYKGIGNDDTRNNKWEYNLATSDEDMPVPKTITIKAKYGADLRNVWPVARAEEQIDGVRMISWATTRGKYCKDGQFDAAAGSTHDGEPTIMGVYAAMGAEIVADPENTSEVHHLVAYWWKNTPSYYRYNHCYEVPDLNVNDTGVRRVSIHNNDPENVKNVLYLVPTNNEAIVKYGFNDLMLVSSNGNQITYGDPNGTFYAVRAYDGSYYAVARQVIAVSTNKIEKQNPSARLHMIRVNDKADHSTQYGNSAGGSAGNAIGTATAPYDLYFYYNRDRYTITYMAPSNNITTATEVTLGTVTLPYGALVTKEAYSFALLQDQNNTDINGWTPATPVVSVCPDRAKDGTARWSFKGWALGPAGVNMQWNMDENAEAEAQAGEAFAIESNLRLYAIWGSPTYKVTFHFNGGKDAQDREVVVENVPANRRYSSTENVIPRPLKGGYTLEGWYMADEDGKITNPETPFTFDETITRNIHVAAKWLTVSTKTFNYTIYYVTDTPHEADKTKPPVQINDFDEIVGTGGTTYYVLDKVEQKNQMFIANSSLNFSAKIQSGYVPRATNKILTMGEPNDTYDVIFYYDPILPGNHVVRFVEAGTETNPAPALVKEIQVQADQTVVTPKSDVAAELVNKGYALVNKNGDQYTAVDKADDLKWIDEDGKPQDTTTLKGDAIPGTITYLVQPIVYTVTYTNAAGSPNAAGAALTAVTAAAGTPVASACNKNPTQYTTKDTFTATNPERVYENGKWYEFHHWSLGANTKVGNNSDFTATKLKVDLGTVGNLAFVANWKEVTDVGSLTVSKTVAGNAGDQTKDFNFRVTLSDTTISGTFDGMTFNNGVAEFTLKHGESKTAAGLLSGLEYTVEETDANEDGYVTTSNGATGTISQQTPSSASFINTKNVGSLKITKTVVGGSAADQQTAFTFTVTLTDTSITGAYGGMNFTNGEATFQLSHNGTITATNLPTGVGYTVAETAAEDYTTTVPNNATGTITASETTVAFTNTKKEAPAPETGSLTVSKKVAGTGAETDRPFSFTVTLSDTTINGAFGGMTFTDGEATFTLKDGESKTAEKLPVGVTYTVTEEETKGYTASSTGAKGTIAKDQTLTAAFTNTKKEAPAPETGSLTVSKKVTGTGAETDRPFSFTVILGDTTISDTYGEMTFTDGKATFALKDGESKTAQNLPVGITYTVTEEETKDYTASSTGARGTVAKDQTLTAAFTNTKKETPAQETGSLTVSKKVTGTGAETDRPFSFTVTLSDTTISGVYGEMTFTDGKATFVLKDGESKTAEKLPVGVTYTVTEEETKDYTASSTGARGTVAKDQTLTAAFTNTKKEAPAPETGDLTVTKKVTGYKADKTKAFTFVVTLDDETINGQYGDMKFVDGRAEFTLKHGESKTAEDLPAGVAYTVKEGDNAGYAVTKTGDTGTIQARRNVYARFTNRKTNLDNYYQTGDETKLELWAGMAALCFLGAVVSLVISKKRKGKFSK